MDDTVADDAVDAKPRAWVRPVVLLVILVLAFFIGHRLLGRFDWDAVWEAMTRLAWWHGPVLVGVLLVRQLMNALPLALFIKGLSLFRALINDLTAAMMAVVAPPPSDMVIRVAMFKSWGIDPSWGLAGATMNTVTFYINRFATPVVGLVIVLLFAGEGRRGWWVVLSALISLTILVVLHRVVHSEGYAAKLGAAAGRLARRVRSSVDPEVWAAGATTFQGNIGQRYQQGLPRAQAGLLLMVLADAMVLLLTLRFVGVSSEVLPAWEVIGVFYLGYPLTLPPLMGLGIFDVALMAAFLEVGGELIEPEVVAALTVWRALTLLGPIILGVGATGWWRWSIRDSVRDQSTTAEAP